MVFLFENTSSTVVPFYPIVYDVAEMISCEIFSIEMATPGEPLLCPITLELFRDPVLAQDGHIYEREAIENWIRTKGTSPLTRQELSLEHLYPNDIVKKLVDAFEKSLQQKNYQFILDVDAKKKKGRPLFQTYGKTIYHAEWLPSDSNQPEIILLKIDGARALKEASFYVNLTRQPHVVRTSGFVLDKKMMMRIIRSCLSKSMHLKEVCTNYYENETHHLMKRF